MNDYYVILPLDGCPQSCNLHGTCRRQLTGDWSCACDEGWSSSGCSVAMETVCDGDVDDDEGENYVSMLVLQVEKPFYNQNNLVCEVLLKVYDVLHWQTALHWHLHGDHANQDDNIYDTCEIGDTLIQCFSCVRQMEPPIVWTPTVALAPRVETEATAKCLRIQWKYCCGNNRRAARLHSTREWSSSLRMTAFKVTQHWVLSTRGLNFH